MSARLGVAVTSCEITRLKPGRRAMVRLVTDNGVLLAKTRVGHRASSAFNLMTLFRAAGFDDASPVSVPEPVAVFEDLSTWIQREVPGRSGVAALVVDPGRLALAASDAAYRIHQADVPAKRVHTADDEKAILRTRFDALATRRPDLALSLHRILRIVERRVELSLRHRPVTGVHRDYYHDQLLVDGGHTTVVDFDLYCASDPALDIGNFVAHIQEHALRVNGDVNALRNEVDDAIDRYCDLAGAHHRAAIEAWAHLSIVRHIALSDEIADRAHTTISLIELCSVL
jgi:Phosphotransferase enzyme family